MFLTYLGAYMTWKIFFLISSKSDLVAIDPKVVFSLLSFWSEKGGLYFFSVFWESVFQERVSLLDRFCCCCCCPTLWLCPPLSLAPCSMLGSLLLGTLGPLYCFFSQSAFWSLLLSLSSDDLLDSGLVELLLGRLLTFYFPVLGLVMVECVLWGF